MAKSNEIDLLFRAGVKKILSNWTALKLAVEHCTGGPNSRVLADNFVDYIADIFFEDGAKQEVGDISDMLVAIMDTQFQTWLEDDSPDEIAHILLNLFQFYKTDDMQGLRIEIDKLPVCNSEESKNMQVEKLKHQQQSENPQPALKRVLEESSGDQEMEEDSSWIHVGRKRRVH